MGKHHDYAFDSKFGFVGDCDPGAVGSMPELVSALGGSISL